MVKRAQVESAPTLRNAIKPCRNTSCCASTSPNESIPSITKSFFVDTSFFLSSLLAQQAKTFRLALQDKVLGEAQSGVSAQVATSEIPAPDCAADGCKGLRIIDGNAEAYRYDAMRRAQLEAAAGNTSS